MKKRLFALLLVLTMILSLAACGSKSDSGSTSTGDKTTTSTDNKGGDTADNTEESNEWTWPLADQEELSFWIVWSSDYAEDPNELPAIQAIEENTNVHVTWSSIMSAEASEKFGLLMASGDYPDIIRSADSYYSGGNQKMVDDGLAYDLTDVVADYMPNYTALRTGDPEVEKSTKTDDGKVVGVFTLASYFGELMGERPWAGLGVRQDWLDELGMDAPVTLDDWHEMLTAFKANYPECEAPLVIAADGVDAFSNFLSAWGILQEFYTPDGTTVKYGVLEPGYKEYVEMMRQWYSEGLIDQNFVSNDASITASMDYAGTGKAGAGNILWGWTASVLRDYGYNSDENYYFKAVDYPVMNAGDPSNIGFRMSEKTKESMVITTNCENLELACRWLDYWYSDEGMLLASMGHEGITYYVDEEGKYHIHPDRLALVENGTYPTVVAALEYSYTLGTSSFGLYNWGNMEAEYEGNMAFESYSIWGANSSYDLCLPAGITLTDDENVAYSNKYTAIKTMIDEKTVKYIMGTESMDTYDAFIQDLYTYGIEECIAYKQAALDRYNAR